jgi:hypothetical protein
VRRRTSESHHAAAVRCRDGFGHITAKFSLERLSEGELVALRIQDAELAQTPRATDRFALNQLRHDFLKAAGYRDLVRLECDPDLTPLRAYPEYSKILNR